MSDTHRNRGRLQQLNSSAAFAFVENENLDNWYWFLERVKVHVVTARPDV